MIFFYWVGFATIQVLVFGIGNSSNQLMGVDVSNFISNYLQEFSGLFLLALFKVWLACITTILFLAYFFSGIRIRILWKFILVFGTQIIFWFGSLTQNPQLYGDFFFQSHPSLTPILFTISGTPPIFWKILGLSILFGGFFYGISQDKKKAVERIFFLGIILFLHLENWMFPLLVILIFPYFFQAKRDGVVLTNAKILLFLLPFYIYKYSSFFTIYFPLDSEETPVIVIAADSLRSDIFDWNWEEREVAPNLRKFRDISWSFEDHHTTIPRTFPSWTDLLTGHYSMSHKIRDMFPSPDEIERIGAGNFKTWYQIIHTEQSQSTAIGSFAGDIFPRAQFGFDSVLAPNFNAKLMTIQRISEAQTLFLPFWTGGILNGGTYLSEIEGLSIWGESDRLVNRFRETIANSLGKSHHILYFSSVAHFPYSPPYPYYKTFSKKNYKGPYLFYKYVDPTKSEKPNREEVEQIRRLYSASIASFDNEFQRLIQILKDRGLYERSLILVTSDHGEALYEDIHGQGHGEHLRGEAMTRVPLMIKFPKDSEYSANHGKKFFGITSSVDIFPTLLSFFGKSVPYELPGKNLLELKSKENWDYDRSVYSETGIWFSDKGGQFFQGQRIPYPSILELHEVVPEKDYQIMIRDLRFRETIAFSKHRALLTSKRKLIYIPTRDGVIYELYDRIADPNCTKNLIKTEQSPLSRDLQKLVQKWEKARLAGDYLLPESP